MFFNVHLRSIDNLWFFYMTDILTFSCFDAKSRDWSVCRGAPASGQRHIWVKEIWESKLTAVLHWFESNQVTFLMTWSDSSQASWMTWLRLSPGTEWMESTATLYENVKNEKISKSLQKNLHFSENINKLTALIF